MTFKASLYNFLDTNLDYDIFRSRVPQGYEGTCLVMQRINTNRQYDHDGANKIVFAHLRFDSYARIKTDATSAHEDLRDLLESYFGNIGGYIVKGVEIIDEYENYEQETKLFREGAEYRVPYIDK